MSAIDRALQSTSAPAEQPQRDAHVTPRGRQFFVGDPIPMVLTKTELSGLTGYSARQIDRFRMRHSHDGIKQLEGPGHPRFCGRALKTWLDGGAEAQVGRRYFGTAARKVR